MTAPGPNLRRAACVLLVLASGCAPRLAPLPAGAGTPFPDYRTAYDEATGQCRGVRTLVGVMALSGRAGRSRMRGNVEVGLEAPDRARLEAPGPFGSRPIFIFVARGGSATLVLPRDRRVLADETPEGIVDALAGVALSPAELRRALAGCGLGETEPGAARSFADGWLAVDAGPVTQWLRRTGDAWRLMASQRAGLEVRYSEFQSNRPVAIRIRRAPGGSGGVETDLTIRLSQVDLNVAVDPSAFEVEVPPDATSITLEELRRAGPLGDREP
jgi:outer membrane lipoprotein-sorting protein